MESLLFLLFKDILLHWKIEVGITVKFKFAKI